MQRERTKHIGAQAHYIKDHVHDTKLVQNYVHTSLQVANVMTNSQGGGAFQRCCSLIVVAKVGTMATSMAISSDPWRQTLIEANPNHKGVIWGVYEPLEGRIVYGSSVSGVNEDKER